MLYKIYGLLYFCDQLNNGNKINTKSNIPALFYTLVRFAYYISPKIKLKRLCTYNSIVICIQFYVG